MNNANSRRKSALERRTADLTYWQAELKTETDEERKPVIKTKIEACKKEIETLKARIS
jgi:hypothetical protein